MAFQRGPKITTDSLQIAIDFGSKLCYSGTGTQFNNLIRKNNSIGYLKNSANFQSGNGGHIKTDGGGNHGVTNQVGDRIDIDTTAGGIDRFSGIHSFSIFFWVKSVSGGRMLSTGSAGSGTGTSDNCIWQMWCDTGQFYWWDSGGGATNNLIATGTWHTTGIWEYIGFTYSYNEGGNNIVRCYTNGVEKFSAQISTSTHSYIDRSGQTNLQWTLGGGYASSCFNTNAAASFAMFHLYNKKLSLAEIVANYNSTRYRFDNIS